MTDMARNELLTVKKQAMAYWGWRHSYTDSVLEEESRLAGERANEGRW